MFKTLLASALLLLTTTTATAQEQLHDGDFGVADVFGNAGQFVLSSDATMEIRHSTGDVTNIGIAPAADFFIIDNLSLGGAVHFQYDQQGNASTTRIGVGPRVGYNLEFTEAVGFWPKVGFSYTHRSVTFESTVAGNTVETTADSDTFTLNLFAPVLFHPVPHFFAGLGPFLDADLAGDDEVTSFGVKFTIGGWFSS